MLYGWKTFRDFLHGLQFQNSKLILKMSFLSVTQTKTCQNYYIQNYVIIIVVIVTGVTCVIAKISCNISSSFNIRVASVFLVPSELRMRYSFHVWMCSLINSKFIKINFHILVLAWNSTQNNIFQICSCYRKYYIVVLLSCVGVLVPLEYCHLLFVKFVFSSD